jgi:cellulose biosynthesis protein BcsQ
MSLDWDRVTAFALSLPGAEMSTTYGKPAIIYDIKAPGSQAYLALARELLAREGVAAAA